MMRSPVSVSVSSTTPMYFEPPAIDFANPPVATVLVVGPISAIMRARIQSTSPMYP